MAPGSGALRDVSRRNKDTVAPADSSVAHSELWSIDLMPDFPINIICGSCHTHVSSPQALEKTGWGQCQRASTWLICRGWARDPETSLALNQVPK